MNEIKQINERWNKWTSTSLLVEQIPGIGYASGSDITWRAFLSALDQAKRSMQPGPSLTTEIMVAAEVALEGIDGSGGVPEEMVRRAVINAGVDYDELKKSGYGRHAVAGAISKDPDPFLRIFKKTGIFDQFKRKVTEVKKNEIIRRFPHVRRDEKLIKILQIVVPTVQGRATAPAPNNPGRVEPAMVLALMEAKGFFGEEHRHISSSWGLRQGREDWREITDAKKLRAKTRKFTDKVRLLWWRLEKSALSVIKKDVETHGPLNRDPAGLVRTRDDLYNKKIPSTFMTAGIVLGFRCPRAITNKNLCNKPDSDNFADLPSFYNRWYDRWFNANELFAASGLPAVIGGMVDVGREGLGNLIQALLMKVGISGDTANVIVNHALFLKAHEGPEAREFYKKCAAAKVDPLACASLWKKIKGSVTGLAATEKEEEPTSAGGIPVGKKIKLKPMTHCPGSNPRLAIEYNTAKIIAANLGYGQNGRLQVPPNEAPLGKIGNQWEEGGGNVNVHIAQQSTKNSSQCFEWNLKNARLTIENHKFTVATLGHVMNATDLQGNSPIIGIASPGNADADSFLARSGADHALVPNPGIKDIATIKAFRAAQANKKNGKIICTRCMYSTHGQQQKVLAEDIVIRVHAFQLQSTNPKAITFKDNTIPSKVLKRVGLADFAGRAATGALSLWTKFFPKEKMQFAIEILNANQGSTKTSLWSVIATDEGNEMYIKVRGL